MQAALHTRLDRLVPIWQIIQMAALLGRVFDADLLIAVTQRDVAAVSCPVLAWSVHYITVEAIALAKNELLRSADRLVAEKAVKTKEFQGGQVGFVLYLDRKRGRYPSDQATFLQEPHTVGGNRDALWWFTCAYQPATYLCVVDCRIDAIRRVAQV
ncbi:MAG TPA: hypothetical protein VK635_31730 [Bradyrhizobium sp.]|nr:hypothetical protein [Bradyrhizobium sp.]